MLKLQDTYTLDPLCFRQCFHLAHPGLAEPKSGIGPSDCVRYHFKDEKSCSDTPKHTKSESCTRYLFKNPDHPGHSGQRGNTGHPGHSSTWSYWTPMSPCSPRSPRSSWSPNQFLSVSLFGDYSSYHPPPPTHN